VVLEAYLADKLNSDSSHMYGRGLYRVLVGKPHGKIPLGKPRRRWEYNIKTYLVEIGRVGMDLSGSVYGHVADCWEDGNDLRGSIDCREFID